MKISPLVSLCCISVLLFTAGCSGGDAANGQARAVTCHACHGGNGMKTAPNIPSLSGQSSFYIAKQLRDFKEGRRSDPTMDSLAASLTDDEIDDIAAYYESLDDCDAAGSGS